MLNQKSTVADLELYSSQLDVSEILHNVKKHFELNPYLPGIILLEEDRLLGIVSQAQFWQYMSLPYSLELSSRISLKHLSDLLKLKTLIINKNTLITDALAKVLEQKDNRIEEPILVQINAKEYRILDLAQLLFACLKIQYSTIELLDKMNQNLQETNQKLKKNLKLEQKIELQNESAFEEFLYLTNNFLVPISQWSEIKTTKNISD